MCRWLCFQALGKVAVGFKPVWTGHSERAGCLVAGFLAAVDQPAVIDHSFTKSTGVPD
jgi:hypothetical protein